MNIEPPTEQLLEEPLDSEPAPSMEPLFVLPTEKEHSAKMSVDYWQAQSFATRLHKEFEMSYEKGLTAGMRSRFYALADYFDRCTQNLRQALNDKNTAMIVSSLRSIIALNTPLHDMHRIAEEAIPLPITLDRRLRTQLVMDLLIKTLEESLEPLNLSELTDFVNRHQFIVEMTKREVGKRLKDLISNGHVQKMGKSFSRTRRAYKYTNLDDASLQAFLGRELYAEFEQAGFPGLSNIENRKHDFQRFFERVTGSGSFVAELFSATLTEVLAPESQRPRISTWHHKDLISTEVPRPYQRDSYTIFRGYGYQGQLIEAPTGSGKTLIGMMCIQDWLSSMSFGEAILVLVPTANYEQQWVRELCYKDIGLQLSPDEVFAGSPTSYATEKKHSGFSPPVLVMTYTALAQLGSPKGKGGFDKISIEKLLQGTNVRYVILDEVHKVVENMQSVSAGVTRIMMDWLRDGSLEGLIGFSGTATAYRERFEELGLQLVYIMPSADLIAYGFVAPFAELGVPFTYSDREKKVINLLKKYKTNLRTIIEVLESSSLRAIFSNIPLQERVTIGRDLLGMYASRKDRDKALASRFREWEVKKELTLNELSLISITQIAKGLSDKTLLSKMLQGAPERELRSRQQRYAKAMSQIRKVRKDLTELISYADILSRLKVKNFGKKLDAKKLLSLPKTAPTQAILREEMRNLLSTTVVGLFLALRSLYYRFGEGRVESINSIIRAEQKARKVNGTIIFGSGKRMKWEEGIATPGYAGVAGIFAQMLGQKHLVPMSVLSSEIYLPWTEGKTLPQRIAEYIRQEIMCIELGKTLFTHLVQGLDIPPLKRDRFQSKLRKVLKKYTKTLDDVGAPRHKEFNREVIIHLQKTVTRFKLEDVGRGLLARLDIKNRHMQRWMGNFFDYGVIAKRFTKARLAQLKQADGTLRSFFVIRMASGERKQLMYDLAARVMDADRVPINIIIVSGWARTGWNVIKPNLLIDATATRNVTAWQQLRGRAMRAMRGWDKDCYEAMMQLLSSRLLEIERESTVLPPDARTQSDLGDQSMLDSKSKKLLLYAHKEAKQIIEGKRKSLIGKIKAGRLEGMSDDEKIQLAMELMIVRNKVTHIYELVKAYGTTIQVRFHRRSERWRRTPAIAAKHAHEYSVNPFTGEYLRGEGHAPLVYLDDPREYSPSKLKKHLTSEIMNRDPGVVEGWIKALIYG